MDVPDKTRRVIPPCEVSQLTRFEQLADEQDDQTITILSVGQYRPEKDHPLQLQAMYELSTRLNNVNKK
ncbi:AGAP011324-PA-like protein [Anopheles sinensis]|uniref:AGAP011324-PA-like protein n=1 Tax=Anopheles sinensis TaxID=74873 RepID=A0A084WU64_ANOSI|nr:AGAP011324-PA-like protein [Anopheles sinensis]